MKVLILTNSIPKKALSLIDEKESGIGGGWYHSFIEELVKNSEIEVVAVSEYDRKFDEPLRYNNFSYYSFKRKNIRSIKYDIDVEKQLKAVLDKEKPDIVHIFGTEYAHTLAMINAFGCPEKILIHIQGIISVLGEKYEAELPQRIVRKNTFRDFIKRDNIKCQENKFIRRGYYETEALRKAFNVAGRTEFDKEASLHINPQLNYFHIQEIMREPFYENAKWSLDSVEKHSIFVSSGYYPIKGLHFAIETLYFLKKDFPDVHLYVAGVNIFEFNSVKKRLRKTTYGSYICNLIKEYDLTGNITFTGILTADQMYERYIRSSVFFQSSYMENSSNSLGEAMLLGMPVVASDVGGTSSILKSGEEGFLYPANEPYRAASYIKQLFEDPDLCNKYSVKAREKAEKNYNKEEILRDTLIAYNSILKTD